MPTKLYVYPYKMGSDSAKALATALDIKRVRQVGKFRWRPGKRVINWGNTRVANWMLPHVMPHVLNLPSQVELASDKIQTFNKLAGVVPIPDIFSQQGAWLALQGAGKFPGLKHAVLCRTLTRANSGRGIVVATTPEELVPAPLYTRYTPKQQEYRVHVFRELGVIDVQQKRRHVEGDTSDPYVRNHATGWVFCREDVHPPQVVLNAAIDAVFALGLDFGAVDIGFHNNIGPCVYEVNTAPGLTGQTLSNYAAAFKQL